MLAYQRVEIFAIIYAMMALLGTSSLLFTNAFIVNNNPSKTLHNTFCSTSSSKSALFETLQVPGMWNRGNSFGKGEFKFYRGLKDWMSPFTDEDRMAYPEIFNLPKGIYEISLTKPLGIVFEEIEAGNGVFVQDLVEDGNAARQGTIQKGDILVGITAIKIVGAKWERRLIPARNFDFDTVVGAIMSNDSKWGCDDVILQFERPGEANADEVQTFMDFFEPPFDTPWKQQQ